MILEIKSVANRRNLSDTIDIVLMTGGILLNIIYIILWIFLLTLTFFRFYKIFKGKSMIHCLKVGLNPRNRCIWFLYYFDYFGFRTIALILLALDPSQILTWSLILVLYVCSFIMFLFPIYESIGDRIITIINSFQLLLVIFYFLISEKLTYESAENKKHSKTYVNSIFMKVYISYSVFVSFLMMIRLTSVCSNCADLFACRRNKRTLLNRETIFFNCKARFSLKQKRSRRKTTNSVQM